MSKRKTHPHAPHPKKTKLSPPIFLANDTLHHIMTYLDSEFILGTLMTISEQWYEQALKVPIRLRTETTHLLKSLRDRKDGLNVTELEVLRNGCGMTASRWIAKSPRMISLTKLSMSCRHDDKELGERCCEVLANSPYLKNLTYLNLNHCWIGNGACHSLSKSSNLTNLRELIVSDNPIDEEGAKLLMGPNVSKLVRLDLSETRIGNGGCLSVLSSPFLAHLEYLNLSSVGATQLSFPHPLPKLTHLILNRNSLKNQICQALQQAFLHLTHLSLEANAISDEGCRLLSQNHHLSHLTHLNLSHNLIGEGGCLALATNPIFKLKCLELGGHDGIGDGACEGIGGMGTLTSLDLRAHVEARLTQRGVAMVCQLEKLRELKLSDVDLSVNGCQAVMSAVNLTSLELRECHLDEHSCRCISSLSHLRKLSLGGNPLMGVDGLACITKSEHMANLRELILNGTCLTNEGCRLLAESDHLMRLNVLSICFNKFDDEGCKVLAQSVKLVGLTLLDARFNVHVTEETSMEYFKTTPLKYLKVIHLGR